LLLAEIISAGCATVQFACSVAREIEFSLFAPRDLGCFDQQQLPNQHSNTISLEPEYAEFHFEHVQINHYQITNNRPFKIICIRT